MDNPFSDNDPLTNTPYLLRPYQREFIQAFHGFTDSGGRRGLAVLPTGMGKTVCVAALMKSLSEENPIFAALVLAHRKELLEQAQDKISAFNPLLGVGIESGDYKASDGCDVIVAGVQSLGRADCKRLTNFYPSIIVVDEAHHAAANTYQTIFQRYGVLDDNGPHLAGVTATPHRLDNKALYGGDRTIFQEVFFSMGLREAVREGWLVDLKGYRVHSSTDLGKVQIKKGDYDASQLESVVDTAERNELAFKSWKDAAYGKRTIIFCAGIDHAEHVAQLFRDQGVAAESVNGNMPTHQRDAIMKRFRSGETTVLTNRDIATEGFDVQEIACVVLLRPTQSWALFTQMIGRGLRPDASAICNVTEPHLRRRAIQQSDKPVCVVIDIEDLSNAHSLVERPQQGDLPSIGGLIGLPAQMECGNHTLLEAAEIFFALPEHKQSYAQRKPSKLDDLNTRLTAIDLLGELEIPDEAISAGALLQWLRISPTHYLASLLTHRNETRRQISIQMDPLGKWTCRCTSNLRDEIHPCGNSLEEAFVMAEKIAVQRFGDKHDLAKHNAPWRSGPVTVSQMILIRKLAPHDPNIEKAIARLKNRGEASNLIDVLRAENPNP
jgi:superfamily II DNA or RNA helicase